MPAADDWITRPHVGGAPCRSPVVRAGRRTQRADARYSWGERAHDAHQRHHRPHRRMTEAEAHELYRQKDSQFLRTPIGTGCRVAEEELHPPPQYTQPTLLNRSAPRPIGPRSTALARHTSTAPILPRALHRPNLLFLDGRRCLCETALGRCEELPIRVGRRMGDDGQQRSQGLRDGRPRVLADRSSASRTRVGWIVRSCIQPRTQQRLHNEPVQSCSICSSSPVRFQFANTSSTRASLSYSLLRRSCRRLRPRRRLAYSLQLENRQDVIALAVDAVVGGSREHARPALPTGSRGCVDGHLVRPFRALSASSGRLVRRISDKDLIAMIDLSRAGRGFTTADGHTPLALVPLRSQTTYRERLRPRSHRRHGRKSQALHSPNCVVPGRGPPSDRDRACGSVGSCREAR